MIRGLGTVASDVDISINLISAHNIYAAGLLSSTNNVRIANFAIANVTITSTRFKKLCFSKTTPTRLRI